MLGRVVFVLCSLTGVALACPHARESPDSQGVAVAFGFMAFCIVGYVLARGNAIRRAFVTSRHLIEGDLEVLRNVARIQSRRTACSAAVCGLVVFAVGNMAMTPNTVVWVLTPPLLLLCISMIALCRLRVLVGLRAEPGLRVLSHGQYLYAVRGKRLVDFVAATPAVIARATSLPTAKIR
jgi:hypothetical protein